MKRNTKHHVLASVGCSTSVSHETHDYFCVSQKEWFALVMVRIWEEVQALVEWESPLPGKFAEPFLASGHQWQRGRWLHKASWLLLHWQAYYSYLGFAARSLGTDVIQFHSVLLEKTHSISEWSSDFFYVFKVRKSRYQDQWFPSFIFLEQEAAFFFPFFPKCNLTWTLNI